MKKIIFIFFLASLSFQSKAQNIEFPSSDELKITADLYVKDPGFPYVLLCHQARFSRGEYIETAPKLNKLGFNCMAIDQRSGGHANNIINDTAERAKQQKKPTEYVDAEQDIRAAVDYLYKKAGKPIILVGSSYSASLVLIIANGNEKVAKVISFSPGEYIKGQSIASAATGLNKPVFVTSSKAESADVKELVKDVDEKYLTHFIPNAAGVHGSRALWKDNPNNLEYWNALLRFLKVK